MPETFQALTVLLLALLPGGLYVWAFERFAGAWGVRLSDRVLRFVEVSAVLHALLAPLTYWLWIEFVRSGRLIAGDVPFALWLVPLLYVSTPILLGSLVGSATRHQARWAKQITGPEPAPRAWDHLFGSHPDGWIRLRLKSGIWLGGAYTRETETHKAYAAGYPEDQDLYLAESVEIDPQTGAFIRQEDGTPVPRGSGILVRWSEVEYLEFIEA
jgi:Family of unknown function (DUF6338)